MGKYRERFEEFHAANPQVYTEFCNIVSELQARGIKRFGVDIVWGKLRYDHAVAVNHTGGRYRLNNNHRAYYSRMWLKDHPLDEFFFDTRRLAEDDE